tara:strand:- start:101 stop:1030 length:930 start_codon:yes stop_codon:yes gene_type:complete
MKYVIIGANGFLAKYFIDFLYKDKKIELLGVTHSKKNKINNKIKLIECSPTNYRSIFLIIKKFKPDKIFNFAAQSNPTSSWKFPLKTIDLNYKPIFHIMRAVNALNLESHIYLISSSAIYRDKKDLINEEDKICLNSPYALSKYVQDQLSRMFGSKFELKTTIIRPFCVTGPGKKDDVMSDWAKGVIDIERKKNKILYTGNIKGVARDFIHIKDFVTALALISESNTIGEYNISSGQITYLHDLLEIFKNKSKNDIAIVQDNKKIRKVNDSIIVGSNDKLKKLGWTQKFSISDIVEDMLNYYRMLGNDK